MSYQTPTMISPEPTNAPPNTLGLRRLMFAVDDIEDTLARLRTHGAELIGEVVRYEDVFLLCYLRGPEGVIVALAEQLGP
jgi:predicted enzyme related to lactoylglutathione lyase